MAKRVAKRLGNNRLSQLLIAGATVLVLSAAYEAATQNDFTPWAPTQLVMIAVILAVFGLYLKD